MFETKPLPYDYTALQPAISEQTLTLHQDKHYAGYVANLNRLTDSTHYADLPLCEVMRLTESGVIFNNAAQAWNHEFYFEQFSANPHQTPSGELLEAIEMIYGTIEEFKKSILTEATSLFGSGWVWLVANDDRSIAIMSLPNAQNPIMHNRQPLLTIDVWEHAYYCDYQNRRADAVEAIWEVLDWSVIEQRYSSYQLA